MPLSTQRGIPMENCEASETMNRREVAAWVSMAQDGSLWYALSAGTAEYRSRLLLRAEVLKKKAREAS